MMDSLSSEHIAYQEMQDDMTSKALPNAGEEKSLFEKKEKGLFDYWKTRWQMFLYLKRRQGQTLE